MVIDSAQGRRKPGGKDVRGGGGKDASRSVEIEHKQKYGKSRAYKRGGSLVFLKDTQNGLGGRKL